MRKELDSRRPSSKYRKFRSLEEKRALAKLSKNNLSLSTENRVIEPETYEVSDSSRFKVELPDTQVEAMWFPSNSRRISDKSLARKLRFLLEKQIHFILIALAVAYLTYSWFSVQLKYSELQAYNFEGITSLTKGNTRIDFHRDQGANRPLITTATGDPLVELAEWGSTLAVNGDAPHDLWSTSHGYSVDAKTGKLYNSMKSGDWTLTQEITLSPVPNRVLVEYYYRNDQRVSAVELKLGQFRYNFLAPKLGLEGFEALGSSRTVEPQDQLTHPRYQIKATINSAALKTSLFSSQVKEGSYNNYGLTSIFTTFSSRTIPINERTLIGSIEYSWEEIK